MQKKYLIALVIVVMTYIIFFGKETVMKFQKYIKGETWDKLIPPMKEAVTATIEDAQAQGLDAMFFEGYRTVEKEQEEINKGTSKLKDPMNGRHVWGIAADIVFANALGFPSWPDISDPRWKQLADIAKKHGLNHPLSWDGPHFELAGYTVSSIRQEFDNPDEFLAKEGVA